MPAEDGAVASRLRASGGVLLGKTNTPHFGYKDMCDNLIGPPCKNPWNLARTSGASSGGAGSAVAAGLGPIAHGSDGSGSIRIPSALCGIFGLKPSLARVPYWPSADLWNARSHNGPMTRTVRDGALLLQAMAGPDPRDPMSIDAPPPDYLAACEGDVRGWRIGWSVDLGFAAVDPEVAELTARAARRFEELGAHVEEAKVDWGHPYEFHKIIYSTSVAARNYDRARERPDWIEPTLMRMILDAGHLSAIDYMKAHLARTEFCEKVRTTFDRYQLLLTPQMPVAAWPADPGPFEGLADLGREARAFHLRPGAVHVPLQPDGLPGGQRPLRLHAGEAPGRPPDRRALAPRGGRAPGVRLLRGAPALGGPPAPARLKDTRPTASVPVTMPSAPPGRRSACSRTARPRST